MELTARASGNDAQLAVVGPLRHDPGLEQGLYVVKIFPDSGSEAQSEVSKVDEAQHADNGPMCM